MRVCQPEPLARQRLSTSAGSRRLIETLGFPDGGRPKRLPPRLRTARDNISSESSGSSLSGLFEVRRVPADFSRIAFPHRKDVACGPTRCVAHHYHATTKKSDTQDAPFSIVVSIIVDLQRQTGEDLPGVLEIEPSLLEDAVSLGWVVCDAHTALLYIH